jgi:transcription elongation factor/antiterminator RfaH
LRPEQWYTLYTKPNSEYRVAAALQNHGLQTYLPEIESFRPHQGRARKPFFPCYLFARIDFETTSLLQLEWTPGLRYVVAFDSRPVPLADEVIELIQRKLDGIEAGGGRPAHNFKPGETVRITAGPLQDMQAILEGPASPRTRVRVLLNILGQASRMQVEVTHLEKVTSDDGASAPKRPRRTRGRGRYIMLNRRDCHS